MTPLWSFSGFCLHWGKCKGELPRYKCGVAITTIVVVAVRRHHPFPCFHVQLLAPSLKRYHTALPLQSDDGFWRRIYCIPFEWRCPRQDWKIPRFSDCGEPSLLGSTIYAIASEAVVISEGVARNRIGVQAQILTLSTKATADWIQQDRIIDSKHAYVPNICTSIFLLKLFILYDHVFWTLVICVLILHHDQGSKQLKWSIFCCMV